jgi:aminocarboxymuconate-semialdehyde decarboxylase
VNEAVKEIDRAYRNLGVKGLSMFSNVNFKPLCSPEFYPIYSKAEEYGLPIFIHPALPFTAEIMKQHKLPAGVYGFTLDTTIAVMSLISNGVLERYPNMKIVHAHLGGVVPYLVRRMDASSRASSRELGIALPKPPSEYYKGQVYPDSISGYMPALRCCLDFVGSKHICLGTDYPHRTSNWKQDVSLLSNMGLSKEDIDDILGGNAARMFKLN